jgi:hypothetical protein
MGRGDPPGQHWYRRAFFVSQVGADMVQCKTRISIIVAAFLALGALAASPAAAQVRILSTSIPATIPDPNAGFNLDFELSGSQFGSATVQVNFYLSATQNGSSGVGLLTSLSIGLQGSGSGPFGAASGKRTTFISPGNLTANGRQLLQSIKDACARQSLFLLADINGGFFSGAVTPTTMGTTKLPDYMFTAGTISSSVIRPGGTTSLSFDLFSRCPASSASRVGIFLTDASLNPLSFIGAVSISAGGGTWSLPPTPITFSSTIPPGNYNILLIADVDGIVSESNENNNAGSFVLTVAPPALAAASAAAVASSLEPEVALDDDQALELAELEAVAREAGAHALELSARHR